MHHDVLEPPVQQRRIQGVQCGLRNAQRVKRAVHGLLHHLQPLGLLNMRRAVGQQHGEGGSVEGRGWRYGLLCEGSTGQREQECEQNVLAHGSVMMIRVVELCTPQRKRAWYMPLGAFMSTLCNVLHAGSFSRSTTCPAALCTSNSPALGCAA